MDINSDFYEHCIRGAAQGFTPLPFKEFYKIAATEFVKRNRAINPNDRPIEYERVVDIEYIDIQEK